MSIYVLGKNQMFAGFVKTAEQFQATNPTYKTESSLAYWFVTPKTPVPPPKWKMSIVTLLGVWPLSMLVPKVIGPIIKHMNPIMSAFLFLYVSCPCYHR